MAKKHISSRVQKSRDLHPYRFQGLSTKEKLGVLFYDKLLCIAGLLS